MKKAFAVAVMAIAVITLCLPLCADVKGKVVDADGEPIAKAKVWVYDYTDKGQQESIVYTDQDGNFTGKCGRNYRVLAAANGYTYGTGYARSEADEITIVLYKEQKVRGKVVDENGKPVAGARVRCSSMWVTDRTGRNFSLNDGADELGKTTTDADGSFVLLHLPNPEEFEWISGSICVEAEGRALINQSVQKEHLSKEIVLTDPLECFLEGKLYLPDKTGTAPKDTSLMVQLFTENGWEVRRATVDEDGVYRFVKLPPGKVYVMLGYPGSYHTPEGQWKMKNWDWALPCVKDVQVTPEKPTVLDLVLTPGATIKGKVLDRANDKPIKNARVLIYHPGKPVGSPSDNVETDENGEFSARVAAGEVQVEVVSFRQEDNYVYFQEEERPRVVVNVADGEEKADIVVKVSPSDSRNTYYTAAYKPIPEDFELITGAYGLVWDSEIDCSQAASINRWAQGKEAKAIMSKLPKVVSEKAMFEAYRIDGDGAEGAVAIILDESKGTGKGFDTMYIDRNRNGDMTDDEPIKFSAPEKDYATIYTDWVSVVCKQGGKDSTCANPIQLRMQVYKSNGTLRLYPQRKGSWKGVIESNKGEIECVLVDYDCDGIYGERSAGDSSGDYFFADTNACGKVIIYPWGSHGASLCNVTKIGSRYYEISVPPVGNKLTIAPYTGPMGKLMVKGEDINGMKAGASQVMVSGNTGSYNFTSGAESGVSVPAGEYKVQYCSMNLQAKDGTGKMFIGFSLDKKVNVEPDKTAELAIGGKMTMAINPEKTRMGLRPGMSEIINWNITIGDKITLSTFGDQSPQQTPKINFYDKSGKLLHSTTAGYT